MNKIEVTPLEVDIAYEKIKKEIDNRGYFLNEDVEFTKNLIKGLLINQKRYGYWACPCRLASGKRKDDLDIICPCDYRDPDLIEFGNCYCSLYVSFKNLKNRQFNPIPERRTKKTKYNIKKNGEKMKKNSKLPIWRCKVCGYLCAREFPPEKCPICGADSDRFEKFE